MIHDNPFISAFIGIPEWRWKNNLRYFLAFSPLIPNFISDWSPIKGYERWYPLQEGDVVVDAGAYPGDYTIWAARRVGPTGKVICFEPGERNRAVLEKNLKAEGLDHVVVIPKGLWDCDTELSFDQNGLASTVHGPDGGDRIAVTRMDDALAEIGVDRIDVLKMDIEGAEIEAIDGCVKTLAASDVVANIASYHIIDGQTTSHVMEDKFRAMGFETRSE